MRHAVLSAAAVLEEGGGTHRDAAVDANRLRRMDRFGRSGVVAGARALVGAGLARPSGSAPDPRFGVVVGTAYGCRDAVTQHERLLAAAARVEDLAPSVFVATVHNAVAGELAIAFGLGGVAETLVSGRTAGLEALALAAARVAKGDADRILVVAAEGIDAAMRDAFRRENPGVTLVESSAAVLVEAEREEEEEKISLSKKRRARFVGADLTFGDVIERRGASEIERLGATGLWEIASDLIAIAAAAGNAPVEGAPDPDSPSKKILSRHYTSCDVHGSRASVTLAFLS